jgi:serine/threonine protein kinase
MPPVSPASISLPDRYRVVGHLASGGMAAVWEAHDELLDRDVAVKILAPHLGEDERARRRFQREARAAAGLSSHPHVVTIYDVGEHAGRVFMVMEIMRGGTLSDRVKSGREIPSATVVRWMREAAEALDAAHDAGVVHRDIKPGNLLLDTQERLAVADFGIARVAWEDQLTLTGQVLGTAAYISPEQAMGEPATAASDRYSLGVVAYELLTGSRPFEGSHFAVQARAHVEDPPPPPSSRNPKLSTAVDAVLERALAKDPRDRYGSAAELAGALERALGEPATAPTRKLGRRVAPEPPRRPPTLDRHAAGPPRRRGSAALLAGVCGLLLLAVVGVVALASRGGGNDPARSGTPRAQHTAEPSKTASPRKTATASPTDSPAPTATETPAPDKTVSGAPDLKQASALQLDGYHARQAGDYATALQKARAALAACGDTHQLSPCGYALYEEGVALNRSGDPAAAIPILQQRLAQYGDDSSGSVAKELRDAQQRAGQKPGKGPREKGPKGKGPKGD